MYEFDVAAQPDTAPFQCVCTAGLPGDGPFVRMPARTQFGDIWLCGRCQEHVLGANRLMSLRLYEQRVAELKATVEGESEGLHEEKARLVDIEQLWKDATTQAREATERAELAEVENASLRQEVATARAALVEQVAELEAVRRGSITVKSVEEHFDRMTAACEANAGPEPKSKAKMTKEAAA